ncbi:hypothetical protein O2K51_01210 [Apibacter raozihei]|uniref:hypothetical protein n=1 Tax=Apibacter raozihei TaxID=2500547 RepID=UPI000FE38813|nr:hypothetical protein [Apibacter raozihei]
MKIELSILIYLLTLSLVFSQGQEKVNIEKILSKQIETGNDQSYGCYSDYGKEDLDALVSIEDTILKNNGYKTPEIDIFNQKIKTIFGRIIDNQSKNSYLKIYKNDKCDKGMDYQPFYTGLDYIYVVKNNNFITVFYSLPSILDYQKIYPEILKYEESPLTYTYADGTEIKISRWKDYKDLPEKRRFNQQLLIFRNKYLFNDDQSQFAWLISNDEYFMRSLVTTFGYTEDKKLLKWVIENTNLPYFDKNAKTENLKDLSKLLWTKDCNGNIRVHQNTLDLIKELSTPDDNLYIKYIAEYISNYMVSFPFKEEELTIEQQAKIAAYILYWGEQYKYDKQYNYNQMFMTRFYNYNYQKDLYEKEFIKNNYYGLPKFKEWYEAAKKEKDYFNGGKGMEDDPQPSDYESRAKYIK